MIKNNKAKALLIQPPVYDFALYDLFLKPFGLLRLGSMLKTAGWNVSVLNALDYTDTDTVAALGSVKRKQNGTGKLHRIEVPLPGKLSGIKRRYARYGILPETFEKKIISAKPDVVFISSGMTYWYLGVAETVFTVKKVFPDVLVVVGGIYATLMKEHCLNYCKPDYVFTGEIDQSFDQFLKKKGFPGIEYLKKSFPMDDLCWNQSAVLRINEGCPFKCDYCASSKISPQFKTGNPEDVFYWMKNIIENRKTRNFAFYDDALLVDAKKIIKPFLRNVIKYKKINPCELNFYSPNAMHIKYVDEEIARLMKAAGFKDIRLGFESESKDFHNEYDRKYSENSFKNAVNCFLKAGFSKKEITVYILAGLPGQRAIEVEETIKYALNIGISLSVSEFSTVPGSLLWEECVKKSKYPIAEEPLFHNNSFFPMEWAGFTRDDMQRLKLLSKTII